MVVMSRLDTVTLCSFACTSSLCDSEWFPYRDTCSDLKKNKPHELDYLCRKKKKKLVPQSEENITRIPSLLTRIRRLVFILQLYFFTPSDASKNHKKLQAAENVVHLFIQSWYLKSSWKLNQPALNSNFFLYQWTLWNSFRHLKAVLWCWSYKPTSKTNNVHAQHVIQGHRQSDGFFSCCF